MITDDDDTELRKSVKNNPSDVHSGINLLESRSAAKVERQGLTNLAAIVQQGPYWMTLLEHGSTDSGEKLKFQAKPVE